MTSLVDTSVKNINNTMAALPLLTGAIGSLIPLLDAFLVNGFDLKTASSLTVAGGVATLAFTGAHSAQADSVVSVAGITGAYAALNGEQKVTTIDAGVVRFATNLPDGVAAGTVTFKMAPLGWAKPFADTNRAVYRSTDPQSTGMYFYVDDTTTLNARVVGYEQMTDINTGVNPFPSAAQMAGGGYWTKSSQATGSNPWAMHGDSRVFFFTVQPAVAGNGATFTGGFTRFFGDFIAFRAGGDAYACGLSYSGVAATASQTEGTVGGAATARIATPRDYTGLGFSALYSLYPWVGSGTALSGADTTLGTFPNGIDGTLALSRKYVSLAAGAPRGELPGFLHVPQGGLLNYYRQLSREPGAGLMAGRTLQAVTTVNNPTGTVSTTNNGVAFFDITGPWR